MFLLFLRRRVRALLVFVLHLGEQCGNGLTNARYVDLLYAGKWGTGRDPVAADPVAVEAFHVLGNDGWCAGGYRCLRWVGVAPSVVPTPHDNYRWSAE